MEHELDARSARAAYLKRHGMYANPARARAAERINQHDTKVQVIDIREVNERAWRLLTAPEIAALQKAIQYNGRDPERVVNTRGFKNIQP